MTENTINKIKTELKKLRENVYNIDYKELSLSVPL